MLSLLTLLAATLAHSVLLWGQTGHYITGKIAEYYLTDSASEQVSAILDETTLPESTVWMDQVRPTDEYNHTADWHWVTVPTDSTYEDAHKNPNGDIIEALERKIAELKEGDLSEKEEWEKLKMVIHMVGDIHQPLHVGTGDDRGGNDVSVTFLGEVTNLHRVWDTDIIESWNMDYEQFTKAINLPEPELVEQWQQATVRRWAEESVSYRDDVYNLPEDKEIGWEYRNKNFDIVEKRLLQAGVRLAGVLNRIYEE